jgi:hypothetical protein
MAHQTGEKYGLEGGLARIPTRGHIKDNYVPVSRNHKNQSKSPWVLKVNKEKLIT